MNLSASPAMRIGLDVGGTKIAGILRAPDGEIVASVRRPTGWGGDAVIEGILDVSLRLMARAHGAEVASIGVGIPGLVDAAEGRVLHAVNLGVESLGVAAAVAGTLGVACSVENDVKAAALGAASLRPDPLPMAYLNLGTGVAAGIIIDGRIWRGARGTAGEVGHIVADPGGRLCGCGQRGCIESLSGGGAVTRAWGRGGDLPILDIFDAADAGDPEAVALRRGIATGAAAAVHALVLTGDVDTVVIGGGITALGQRLEDDIRGVLRANAAPSPFIRSLRLDERIEMLPADSPVAAIGAALLGLSPAHLTALDKEIVPHG